MKQSAPRHKSVMGAWRLVALFALAQAMFGLDPSKILTQYAHRGWQQEQGLPQPTVYTITQSHDGYLWLGTQGRLVRFDGVRFTELDGFPEDSFGNHPINAIYEDRQNGLWIGSGGAGLMRFSGGVFTRYPGLPDEHVNCVTPDQQGNLWICTLNGLARLRDGRFTTYTTAQGLPSNHIRTALVADDGALWVAGTDFGLARWDGTRFAPVHRNFPEHGGIHTLLSTPGAIWAGTDDGLFRFEGGRMSQWTAEDGLPSNSVLALAAGDNHSVWIGTSGGVSRLQDGEFNSLQAKDGLTHSTVLCVFQDREGSLWVGTKNGLNQFLDGRVTPYTTQEGMPSNDTGPVYADRSGQLWVGTRDAGLARFDGHRFTVLTSKQGLPGDAINTICEDGDGDLWVGTSTGLARLRDGRVLRTYRTRDGLPSDRIESLFRDAKGVLWVGTAQGLARVAEGRFIPIHEAGLGHKRVLSLGGGQRVELFVATEDGALAYLMDGKFTRYVSEQPPLPPADSFYAEPGHVLWIGSLGGGLRRYHEGKVTVYSTADGLFDDQIYATLLDDDNNLWMASSKGIFRTSKRELDEFAAGRRLSITSYPLNTGEVRFECRTGMQPLAWKTQDGKLWFSTDRGLILVDPYRLRRDAQPPPILIRDAMVNNRLVGFSDLERLHPGENNLEFRYLSLSFRAPERVTFRYMLEGYDRAWRDARNTRFASYTNLPPGRYRFRVTACNADGICNAAGSAVSLTVVPYFFQRRWFYVSLAALAIWLGWLAFRLRVRYLENRFTLVVAERTRIARELHDTLLQGLSSITMQMQALSNRMASSTQKQTLDDIIQDAGSCLKEARKSLWGLRSPEGGASLLPKRIAGLARQLTDGNGMRLKLNIDNNFQPLPAELESHLARIAQEALTNAGLHSQAKTVEVVLHRLPDKIALAIRDDGRGFSPQEPPPTGHYGLLGIRERVAEIAGDLELESELGKGTTVRVTVPADKLYARASKVAHEYHHSPLR